MQPRQPLIYLRKHLLMFNGLILHNTSKSQRVVVNYPTLVGRYGEVHTIHDEKATYNITPNTLATINVAPYPIFWLRNIKHNTSHHIFQTPDEAIHTLIQARYKLTYKGKLVTFLNLEGFEIEHDTFIKWQNLNYCTYVMFTGEEWIQFAIRYCPAPGTRTTDILLYQSPSQSPRTYSQTTVYNKQRPGT